MVRVQQRLGVSERRACEVLGQARSTQRRSRKRGADEAALRADVVKVAVRFGRYGYRMVTGMLRAEGWVVNHKRVERIWREEGLKVPKKQPKRGRLWLTDGSCIRLRPLYRHHVWAYDFVADRTHDGRPLKMLTVLDEYSRECLAIVVARRLRADDVLQTLSELFVEHGPPANLRSDNGPEFTAKVVREWLERVEALSANVRETRSTQRIRVGRRQRKRTCWDCEREWKRMVVPLEPGRPSEARQLLRTQR